MFLHSWLKEWKLRADREERTKQKDKKEEGSYGKEYVHTYRLKNKRSLLVKPLNTSNTLKVVSFVLMKIDGRY